MIKVTVAIPVYNDEPFIERCIASILNQTLDQQFLEIICIDDGSTDQSGSILDRYAKEFSNIHVEHQENSGSPSGPRNKAIELAKGKYIYFVDATDFLGEEALERMVAVGEKYDSDIVIGKYKGVNRGVPEAIFSGNPAFFSFYGSNALTAISSLKMFKVSLLHEHHIRFFEETSIGEDHTFTVPAYICSNGIAIVKDYDCYYATRNPDAVEDQWAKQERPFSEVFGFIQAALQAIVSLDVEDGKIKRGLQQYWDRLLDVEIMDEVNRKRAYSTKKQNLASLAPLLKEYGPEEHFEFFTPIQKVKFRLLEKGEASGLMDYIDSEKKQEDLQVYRGELYPAANAAFKAAVDEKISFTNANKYTACVTDASIKGQNLVIEGHQYHSRFFPENPFLTLLMSRRDTEEVYRIPAQLGLAERSTGMPLLTVPEGKEKHGYFHAVLDLSFVREIEEPHYFDFSLVSDYQGYKVQTRLMADARYFEDSFGLFGTAKVGYFDVQPYRTKHGNFSAIFKELDKISDKLSAEKAVFYQNGDEVRICVQVHSKYDGFLDEIDQVFLAVGDWSISGTGLTVQFKNGDYFFCMDIYLSKHERRKLANSYVAFVVNQVALKMPDIEWVR